MQLEQIETPKAVEV